MDVISEIMNYQNRELNDVELSGLLDMIGRLKKKVARKEALQVLYRTVNLSEDQFQSIVDHPVIIKEKDLVAFAQKQARHNAYRTTQQYLIENEKVSLGRALMLMVIILLLAGLAAYLVPEITSFFSGEQ